MAYTGPDSKRPCTRCGALISNRGIAQWSHNGWHKRVDAKREKARRERIIEEAYEDSK